VLLCVDYRRGMHFATRGAFKSVVAARAAAALAWSALDHGDRIGGIVYSEREHRELRPQRGKAAVLHMIAALVQHSAWLDGQHNAADPLALRTALIRMRRVARPGSLVFVLSDFRDLGAPGCEEALGRIASHSEVALVMLHDPLERELPPPDLYRLRDGEASVLLDTRQQAQVAAHRARFAARVAHLEALSHRYRMRLIRCATDGDWVAALERGLGADDGVRHSRIA
jgi:uncharacterized protein (DUF58 family)